MIVLNLVQLQASASTDVLNLVPIHVPGTGTRTGTWYRDVLNLASFLLIKFSYFSAD